jgi:hypothetical protein
VLTEALLTFVAGALKVLRSDAEEKLHGKSALSGFDGVNRIRLVPDVIVNSSLCQKGYRQRG